MTVDTSDNSRTTYRLEAAHTAESSQVPVLTGCPYLWWHRLDSGEGECLHRGTLGSGACGLDQHPLQQTTGLSDQLEFSTGEDPFRTVTWLSHSAGCGSMLGPEEM